MKPLNTIFGWFSYPSDEKELFQADIRGKNATRLYYASFLLSLLSFSFLVVLGYTLPEKGVGDYLWKFNLIVAHLVIFAVTIISGTGLHFIIKFKLTHARITDLVSYFVFLFVLVMCVVISAIDQYVTTAINPLMIGSMAIPLVVMIPPVFSFVFFFAGFVLFLIIIPWVQSDTSVILSISINAASAVFIGLLISIILWHLNKVRFKQSRVIERQQAELQKQNDELASIADELHAANESKDKLFSIIAHDLRSPFNAFLGFTELLTDEKELMGNPEYRSMILALRTSALNYYRLLENLLDWVRIQRKVFDFHPVDFRLKSLLDECVEIVEESADKKEIKIVVVADENLVLHADKIILSTIVRNLLYNAIKFTPRGGMITIAVKTDQEGNPAISVADSGIGMTPEIIENLFEKDADTGRTGTEGEPSTGLGLLLCKDLVEMHNGIIHVESEVGKGSIFTFTIGKTGQMQT